MILDIPELLLKVAHFSDWRTVHALQRLNRGAYRDQPVLVQEEMWHCAVRTRWPWACADGWFSGNGSRYYTRHGRAAHSVWELAPCVRVSANHRLRRNPVVTINEPVG